MPAPRRRFAEFLNRYLKSALIAAVLTASGLLMARPAVAQPAQGGEIHGSIYTVLGQRSTATKRLAALADRITLPDISVEVVNTATSAKSAPVKTDLDGSFVIPAQPQAIYKVCWQATGFASGCSATTVTLHSRNEIMQPIEITPQPGILAGRVTFNDDRPCRFVAPIFAVNSFTSVRAAQSGKAARTVRANASGYYVLGGLAATPAKLTASCEKASVTASATPQPAGVVAAATNLVLPNATPAAIAYASTASGVVRAATIGSKVTAVASTAAPGGHKLSYRWLPDPPQPGFVSANGPNQSWQVPPGGQATLYVLAHDGFGGYAMSKVALSTTPNRIVFGGTVLSSNGSPIGGAQVTVDSIGATTDAAGNFSLTLPAEAPRYVLSIEKTGFKLFSHALYAPTNGVIYRLYPAQSFTVDPTGPIHIIEQAQKNPEGRGVEVEFDPNTIAAGADGKGALATGPLLITAATYAIHDPSDQLPGDYAGLDKAGKQMRLSSFGSSFVGIQDPAGNRFNLAPGKTAKVRLPIDSALLAAAPATIALWQYDEKTGAWIEAGQATRNGNAYETTVGHFSAVNMDLALGNGACTRVVVDTAVMPAFQLRMTTNSGPGVPPDHQNQWISDAVNVVVRQPPGVSVTYDVVDGDGNVLPLVSKTFTVGASSPTGTQWPPPPPTPGDPNAYADCTTEVRYDLATAPSVAGLFPTFPSFLSYQTPSSYLPANAAETTIANNQTAAYYAKIDPNQANPALTKTAAGNVDDFAHWKTANGFDAGDDAHASYFNNYDLGFGRDMHMKRGGACPNCLAYYVTNYHNADDALAQASPIATVAMEYAPAPGTTAPLFTKFYVFGANGAISNTAALDDFGPKFVPALCVICHNGNISNAAPTGDASGNLVTSRFIPFDLDSFGYPAAALRSPAVEAQFKLMNQGVLATNVSPSIHLLIQNWYGMSETDPSLSLNFNGNKVPSGWTTPATPTDQSALYDALVKPYCRSCHTTRDASDPGQTQDITWQSYDSLDTSIARFIACGDGHLMPQAERNFGRYWFGLNPHGPAAFAASPIDSGPGACH